MSDHDTAERAAEDARARLDEQAASVRALLDQEQTLNVLLTTMSKESLARLTRLRRALAALTDAPVAAPKEKDKNDWSVSAKTVEKVRRHVVAVYGDGRLFTRVDVQESGEWSNSTVGKALTVLREDGVVRIAATHASGRIDYALMPEHQGPQVSVNGTA